MSKHTQTVDEYDARIGSTRTMLYGAAIDPGDGDTIMVYVDATPEDDPRRRALMTQMLAGPDVLDMLGWIVAYVAEHPEFIPDDDSSEAEWFQQARAAIAKAGT